MVYLKRLSLSGQAFLTFHQTSFYSISGCFISGWGTIMADYGLGVCAAAYPVEISLRLSKSGMVFAAGG